MCDAMDELCERAACGVPMTAGMPASDSESSASVEDDVCDHGQQADRHHALARPQLRGDDGDVSLGSDSEPPVPTPRRAKPPAQGVEDMNSCQLTARMVTGIQWHQMMPASLGIRATSLTHKTSAVLHSTQMETSSARALQAYCCSVVSFTTDMGTELGLAHVSSA